MSAASISETDAGPRRAPVPSRPESKRARPKGLTHLPAQAWDRVLRVIRELSHKPPRPPTNQR
jgi:hypothetical protein